MSSPHLLSTCNLVAPIVLITLFLLSQHHHVRAANYTVGDEINGWRSGTGYLTWSQKYNFTVGDVLVFSYVPGQHNVYQVTEATFRSCNASTGVEKIYSSGDDRVTLTDAGSYWFICNINGHCEGGMRFGINVALNSNRTTAKAPSIPPPPQLPPQGNGVTGWSSRRLFGLALGVLCCLLN